MKIISAIFRWHHALAASLLLGLGVLLELLAPQLHPLALFALSWAGIVLVGLLWAILWFLAEIHDNLQDSKEDEP